MMPTGLRRLMLVVHVACSVGWMGAIAAYVVLTVVGGASPDAATVRAAYAMLEPVALYSIVPLALGSLLTGIVQSLGTPWGLFRHYWVVLSLGVTVFATVVLLLHMSDIGTKSARAADPSIDLDQLAGDTMHSVGGLVLLCVPLVLNIVKPRGLTRYGQRKRSDRVSAAASQRQDRPDQRQPTVSGRSASADE